MYGFLEVGDVRVILGSVAIIKQYNSPILIRAYNSTAAKSLCWIRRIFLIFLGLCLPFGQTHKADLNREFTIGSNREFDSNGSEI